MDMAGAYGGQKAGGTVDPLLFVKRPQVMLRGACWLFSIIVFGCIASQGWRLKDGKDVCLYNGDSDACNYGVMIGVIGFLASMGFLVGEYMFEQMSSVKTRKHFLMADCGFSALWSFLFFVAFCYLSSQWKKAEEPPMGVGVNNVQSAIVFSLFSIGTWAGCAYFACKRLKQGVDAMFGPGAQTYEPDATTYSSYPVENDTEAYNEPPFGAQQQQQQQRGDFQAPTY